MTLNSNTLRELLATLRFTGSLPDKSLHALAGAGVVRDYAAGQILFREGSASDETYVIVAGHVALDMHVEHRGAARLVTLGPGDLVGWSGVVGDKRMTTSAVALEASRVVAFPARRITELCESDHEFGYAWMRATAAALARRLLATRLQLLDLFAAPSSGPSLSRGGNA